MSEIGVAMVGCGQIAEAHLKAIEACEGARLAYCVDVDSARAQSAAERYACNKHSVELGDALTDSDVEAVVLCLPHDLHVSFTCDSLIAEKHVLVEKPMALHEAEARVMVAAAEEAGRNLMVGQSTRFTPSHQEAKRLLASGRIGKPINVVRQTCFWVEKLSTDWRRKLDSCGGLYLPLFGSHDVDAMLWLLNDEPDRVSAAIRAGSDLSDGDINGWIGLTFLDGKLGSIAFSLRTKETRQATMIVGSEGSMTVERNRIFVEGEDVPFDSSAGAFTLQMKEFIESIRDGRAPSVPGSDGVRTMRVLDLARMASEQQSGLAF
jgi:predicted dehydrogenase